MSSEIQQFQVGIAALESQRTVLGDAVTDAALTGLRARLAELAATHPEPPAAPVLRQVSVLFLDVVGSTRLSQWLDPEDLNAVLDGALARCAGVVRAHRGKVLQYAGDSLLAVWGADAPQEDDAERAVDAGLALLAQGRAEERGVQQAHGREGFAVRVGIHTGPVLLGTGVNAQGSIRGQAVNVAARMEQSAPPGALRISQETWRLVRGSFDADLQPPLRVKGMAQPMATYLVRCARPRAQRGHRRGIEGLEVPLTGRADELAALHQAWQQMLDSGRLAGCTLVGDAGLGKSRLLAEFERVATAARPPLQAWRSRGHPQGLVQEFGYLRDLLFWHLEIADSDALPVARRKLVEAFGNDARAEEQAALLGQLLGLDCSASAHVRGLLQDGRQLRVRAYQALVSHLHRQAAQGPLLLLLDDLHWADDGTLDFLDHLGQAAAEVPIFVLATARPSLLERRPGWGAALPGHATIRLEPLAVESRNAMADALLGRIRQPPPALRALLTENADGNPFYMEELLQMLIDRGIVARGTDDWTVAAEHLPGLQVPATLVGVLQARLAALPAPERSTLQQASVVGPVFWDEVLAHMETQAPETLPALCRRDLTHGRDGSAFDGTREYAFRHHLLHQVTYDSVLRLAKREQHRLTALWLVQRSGGRSGEVLGLIAEHFERAGLAEPAAEHWMQAAEAALARDGLDAAQAHAERAEALQGTTDKPTSLQLRVAVLRDLLAERRGDSAARDAAIAEIERVATGLDDTLSRCLAGRRRAWLAMQRGQVEAGLEQALATLTLAHSASGDEASMEQARAHTLAMRAHIWLSRAAPARAHAEAGLALIEARRQAGLAVDANTQGGLLNGLGVSHLLGFDWVRAIACYEQALACFREGGSRWASSTAISNLANVALQLGEVPRAHAALEEALALALESGSLNNEILTRGNLARVLVELDRLDEARRHAEQAVQLAQASQQAAAASYAMSVLTHVSLQQGDTTGAERRAAADVARLRTEGQPFEAIAQAATQADALRLGGRVAEAAVLARQLHAEAVALGHAEWHQEFEIRWSLHQALAAAGDPGAEPLLAQAHANLLRLSQRVPDPAQRDTFLRGQKVRRELLAAGAAAGLPAAA